MKRISTYFYLLIIMAVLTHGFENDCVAWDDVVTHRDLSQISAEHSIIGAQINYLQKIGYADGLNSMLTWSGTTLEVYKWIRGGAQSEDAGSNLEAIKGVARFNNHFHNPQKPWESAGLNDIQTGESALLWAQDEEKQSTVVGGDWSWSHIRGFYLLALTSATEQERQAYFAQLFRGLGQQMHLIQDMAVPYHVRNDAHPLDAKLGKDPQFGSGYFETWAKENSGLINGFAANPQYPAVSFSASPYGLAPITQLFDTTKYLVTPPSNGLDIGLAEYTNENYFSDDTIFAAETYTVDDKHYSPFPKQSSTNLQFYIDKGILGPNGIMPETIIGEDGVPDISFWIKKDKEGEIIKHFVKPTYLTDDVYDVFGGLSHTYMRTFYLDEQCHADYASYLVPRAVGYSAGLINYFFRGQIDLEQDANDPSKYVINNNSDEDIHGTFSLYYDDKSGNRKLNKQSLTYGLATISAHDKSSPVTFDDKDDAKEPGTYTLVFQGTMGGESGAIVGRVVKFTSKRLELTPPSHYVYGIIDGSIIPQQFTTIKAKVRSPNQDSPVTNGTIQAVARYKIRSDYKPDLSTDPPGDTAAIAYAYSKSAPQDASLSVDTPKEFIFDFSAEPIPAGLTDLYLNVVYTQMIENGATTVAIGIKDITEPTHHTFWNLSDRFALNNQLYTAAAIHGDNGLTAAVKSYGLAEDSVDPYFISLKIAYFDASSDVIDSASIAVLPPGSYIRLISLFDKKDGNYVRESFVSPAFNAGLYYGYPVSGAVNQNTSGIFTNASILTMRSVTTNYSQGLLSCAPTASATACPYEGGYDIPPVNAAPQSVNINF